MAAKSAGYENSLLQLIFNGTTFTGLAINTTTSPVSSLWVSLHDSNPIAGNQTTGESTYTGYARQGIARTTGGWTVTTNSVSPAATISFPVATGGSDTITYFGVGTASTGTGQLLYSGPISPTLSISSGIQPQLTTATVISES